MKASFLNSKQLYKQIITSNCSPILIKIKDFNKKVVQIKKLDLETTDSKSVEL